MTINNYNRIRVNKLNLLRKAVDKYGLGSPQHLKALKAYEDARTNYGEKY